VGGRDGGVVFMYPPALGHFLGIRFGAKGENGSPFPGRPGHTTRWVQAGRPMGRRVRGGPPCRTDDTGGPVLHTRVSCSRYWRGHRGAVGGETRSITIRGGELSSCIVQRHASSETVDEVSI